MKTFFTKNKRLFILLILMVVVIALGVFLPEKEKFSLRLNEFHYSPYKTEYTKSKEELLQKPYVLIEFFTLQCPHCVKNIPFLNNLSEHPKLNVVGYIMESENRVKEYAKKYDVRYPLARANKEYIDIFEPTMVPMSFIIDTKTLEVKEKIVGHLNPSMIEKYLK